MEDIRTLLARRFGGVIRAGSHDENGHACVLELESVRRGDPWTDHPANVRCLDIRAINDIDVSDQVRTEGMVRMLEAYSGSRDWPLPRLVAVVGRIVVGTVRLFVGEAPLLSDDCRQQCRCASDLPSAQAAAAAATSILVATGAPRGLCDAVRGCSLSFDARESPSVAAYAGSAGWVAGYAGRWVARVGEWNTAAARQRVFEQAVDLWVSAAQDPVPVEVPC